MRGVRLTDAKYTTVEKAAIERGFSSASAFIRALLTGLDGAGRGPSLRRSRELNRGTTDS
jgi:hypothetical protein